MAEADRILHTEGKLKEQPFGQFEISENQNDLTRLNKHEQAVIIERETELSSQQATIKEGQSRNDAIQAVELRVKSQPS